jgi:hypothetical protein
MKKLRLPKTLPKKYNFLNETGKHYGDWKVIRYAGREKSSFNARWLCQCSCGHRAIVRGSKLRSGESSHCKTSLHRTNQVTKYPEYRLYTEARQRCTNPNSTSWHHYGKRGIKFRFKTFWQFIAALNGFRPSPRHQIDRFPDNNGNYEVGNVRWALPWQNALNRRTSLKRVA